MPDSDLNRPVTLGLMLAVQVVAMLIIAGVFWSRGTSENKVDRLQRDVTVMREDLAEIKALLKTRP